MEGNAVIRAIISLCLANVVLLLVLAKATAEEASSAGDMVVVVGASGTEEYGNVFSSAADRWQAIAKASSYEYVEIGRSNDEADRSALQSALHQVVSLDTPTPVWLVLVGHGTYDRNSAKFNLRGPDVASTELAEWLRECSRPLVIINAFSCSGAFLKDLRGADRVIITATNSGTELNYSRFARFFAESIGDDSADLDHDHRVSLLEAYLLASSKVARFYQSEDRLATEHSLLEDNDDGKGTSADFFVGIRAEAKSKSGAAPDGQLAHRFILVSSSDVPQLTAEQTAERDRIETEVETLRVRKSSFTEDEYYQRLEDLFVRLARVYDQSEESRSEKRR